MSDVDDISEEIEVVYDADVDDEGDEAHESGDDPGARQEDGRDHGCGNEESSVFSDGLEERNGDGVDCMWLLIPSATVA